MEKQKKRPPRTAPGGRLSRSEITTVRLDPKLRFAAEIASRAQRRTVSSLLEVALSQVLAAQSVVTPAKPKGVPLLRLVERLWDPDEAERFVKLAQECPWLLNYEEDRLWKYIRTVLGVDGPLTQAQSKSLHEHYETFDRVARGELPESEIVKLRLRGTGG